MYTPKKTTYFTARPDSDFEEFSDKETALESEFSFVIEETHGTRKNGNYTNQEYDYIFYNSVGEEISSVHLNGWSIEIESQYDHLYQKGQIYGVITDPLGKAQPSRRFGHSISGVECAFQSFYNISNYDSFETYTLSERVSTLQKEVDELKRKFEELKQALT